MFWLAIDVGTDKSAKCHVISYTTVLFLVELYLPYNILVSGVQHNESVIACITKISLVNIHNIDSCQGSIVFHKILNSSTTVLSWS